MANVVTQLIVDARGAEEGSAAYVRAMKAAQSAADATLDREAKLQGAIDKTVVTLSRGAGSIDQVGRRWSQLIATIDPVAAAQQKAAKAIEDATLRADAAVRRLGVSQQEAARAVEAVRAKYEAATAEVVRATAAANDISLALARMRAQYDPIYSAQLRHKEALEGISEAERAGAISANLAMQARMAATSAMNDQIQKLERLAQAQKDSVQRSVNSQLIVPDRGADIAAYGEALDKLQAKWDPLFAAEQAYLANMEELQGALATGALTQEVYNKRVAEQGEILDAAAAKVSGLAEAQEQAAAAVKAASAAQEQFNSLLGVRTDFGTAGRAADVEAYGRALSQTRAQYDPVYRAQQQYLSGLQDLRSAYASGAIPQQVFTARLAEQKAAFVEAAAALGMMSAKEREYAAAAEAAARVSQIETAKSGVAADLDAYVAGLKAEQAALVPLVAAQQQYEASEQRAAAARDRGIISQQQYEAAVGRARATLLNQTIELKKSEEANARLAKGVGLNAYAWQNLSFQVNDVVTSLASGISPFQTLAQQGGQIYQILQSGQGGVGGALRGIADRLLAINPLVGVFGVLAAGLITAAVAANSFAKAQRDVQLALLGAGQGAGLSADQIQDIAEKASRTSTITVAAARDIEKAFLDGGKVYGEVFAKGVTAADDFAKASKQDVGDAARFIAGALGNLGGGGFEDLAKKAGNFDAAFEKTVRDAINNGDDLKAQQLVVERFGEAFDKASQKATGLQSVLQRADQIFKNAAESFGKTVSQSFNGAPLQQQIQQLEQARRNSVSIAEASGQQADTSALDAKIAAKTKALNEQTVAVEKNAKAVRSNADAQNQAGTRSLVPQVASFEQLQKAARDANKELNALEAQQASGAVVPPERINASREAVAAAAAGLKDYASAGGAANMEMAKAKEVLAANLRAIQAVTPEQKAEAERQKVLADAYGTAASGAQRTRAANDAYNRSMAEARQQTVNTNRAQDESTTTANKLADATTKTGNSIEFLRAQRQAEAEAANGTISQSEVEERRKTILRASIAALNQQKAEEIRASRDTTAVQQGLNDKVAAGSMASAEAQRRAAALNEQMKLAREVDAASGAEKEALAARLKELTSATEAQLDADKRSQVLSMTEETNRQIATLEREGELLGSNNRDRAIALAQLQAQQNLQRQGISITAPESVKYIDQEKLKADLTYAKEQYTRLAQDISSAIGGIFDDLTSSGKKSFASFADSFSKGFSRIGSRLLEQNIIQPLISGGLDGKGSSSSFFSNLQSMFDGEKLQKAVSIGSSEGIFSGLKSLFSGSRSGASNGGFASSSIGQGLVSAGVGASIGYQSQSPLIGTAGGALAGFAVGGPIGGLVGGAAGLLGGLFGESQAKKQAKKQLQQELQARREALDQARPQIEQLALMFEGGSIGNVGKQISDALTQAKQAIKTASDGGDQALADKLMRDYQSYVARMTAVFGEGFNGVLEEVQAGFGTSGPFSQAMASVQQFGEAIKGFVADAGRLSPAAVAAARGAAVQGALSQLDAPKQLSATQTELARINGTATGLNQVLKDLGLSAEEAATAIRNGTNKALDQLRTKFSDDLGRKINDALNKGYLNDASDLLKEVASLQDDASAIGGDLGQVDTYFTAAAQKIVDGSQLAGSAFDELIAKFPELAGRVREYSATASMSADQAAKAAQEALSAIQDRMRGYEDRYVAATFETESLPGKLLAFDRAAEWERWQEGAKGNQAINELEQAQGAERLKIITDFAKAATEALNSRLKGYADRLFAATNDTSTLGGQLAAYDRQAQQEREDEVKAGGQALAQLEQTQYAERLKIITDFQKQATEAAKQQLAAAQTAFETFVKNIKTYLDNLRSGASSPLSPKDRLAAAQSQYDAQLALAKGGDRTALDSITQYSDALLEASKAYNASGAAYQATFEKILADLSLLPTQVSAEQFIVDAINDSKDAIVSATDAMRAALLAGIQANSPPLIATALLQNFQMLDTSVNGLLDQGEFLAGLGPLATADEQRQAKLIFNAIDTNGDGQLSKLELQNASSQRVEQYTAATNSNVDSGNTIATAQKQTMDSQSNILNSINSLNNSQLATQQQLVNLNASINSQNAFIQDNTAYTNQALQQSAQYQGDTYLLQGQILNNLRSANAKNGAPVYATGGWVSGPGTGTSDSIAARVSNGEFVVNAASARLNGPLLEAINDNAGRAMPAVAMPVPMTVGRDDSALIAEVRALRAEVAALRGEQREGNSIAEAGHVGTMREVRRNTDAVADGNATASRQALAKKVA